MKKFVNAAFPSTDIKDFLETSTNELDDTFSSTCTFPRMTSVLLNHVCKMKIKVEQMRRFAWLLSPGKATGTIKATSE